MAFDSKEYTRLRDIVVKRNKRAVAAGLAAPIHFPTVREIKSGYVDPGQAMRAVEGFHSGGSTVTAIRQTGLVPVMPSFPVAPPERKLSSEEKRQQKRERDLFYRQRKRIQKITGDSEKTKQYVSFLKALNTMQSKGFDLGGIDLTKMTPTQAQSFVEYIEYRFSQGDFKKKYVIDIFTEDYSKIMKKRYTAQQIISDFEQFLEDRHKLKSRKLKDNEGLTYKESMRYWKQFIKTLR